MNLKKTWWMINSKIVENTCQTSKGLNIQQNPILLSISTKQMEHDIQTDSFMPRRNIMKLSYTFQ